MSKIEPCLWFATEAEEAANFYVSLLPNSKVDHVQRNIADGPGGKAGTVLMVKFTLAGQRFMGLNGGKKLEPSHAVSFTIECEDQQELDRVWNALASNGGKEVACGWVSDRYGFSWQIVPKTLSKLLGSGEDQKTQRVFQQVWSMKKLDFAALQKAYDGD